MSHNTDLERMRGTVEELSLKKQLPLRQHTDKPILKYDTSISKPVQLFNQGDTLVRHDSRSQHAATPGTPTGNAAQNSSAHVGLTPNQKRARHGSSGSSHSSPAKGVNNPYSRPLSAKEVIEDVQQNHRHRRFHPHPGSSGPSTLPVASSYNSPVMHNHPELDLHAGAAAALQLNSFLRPQSGAGRDSVPANVPPQKRGHRTGSGVGDSAVGLHSRELGGKQHIRDEGHGHRVGAKCPLPSEQSAKAALHQAFALASTTSASHPVVSGLPPRPKNAPVKEARSHIPTGHQGIVVRNPHYTPSKPYSDISDPIANSTGSEYIPTNSTGCSDHAAFNKQPLMNLNGAKPLNGLLHASKPVHASLDIPKAPLAKLVTNGRMGPIPPLSPGGISSMASVEESGLPLHNLTASSLLNTKMGMLRKMPVTNTLTGTLYYKKSFREASRQVERKQHPSVLEHRPRGDGAPAKQVRAAVEEKVLIAGRVDVAEEEDDDDNSTPSG